MYLHLGNDVVIRTEDIIAMFDIDACTVSKKTRDFLALAHPLSSVNRTTKSRYISPSSPPRR